MHELLLNVSRELERNLQAISRTPKVHREEMLQYVFQPTLIKLDYSTYQLIPIECPELRSLGRLCTDTDIEQDPYVIKLRSDTSRQNQKLLLKILTSRKTYCMDQLQKFYNKAMQIFTELGAWPLNLYMRACIRKFETAASDGSIGINDLDEVEKTYLKSLFACIKIPAGDFSAFADGLQVTPKVQRLIDFLVEEQDTNFRGLVFVQTRAQVAVLAQLLSLHGQTRDQLKVSTFVGASTSSNRKFEVGELVDIKNQNNTLDDLRNGRSNLIITTTALEEGIDVSACNVVVCFERPQTINLKSFIQRRGRARKSVSKFVLMFEDGSDATVISTWQQLENEMIEMYMDDMRCLQEIKYMEATDEGEREFCVESTWCVPFHPTTQLFIYGCLHLSASRVSLLLVFQPSIFFIKVES